jgi:hypothetical protein
VITALKVVTVSFVVFVVYTPVAVIVKMFGNFLLTVPGRLIPGRK